MRAIGWRLLEPLQENGYFQMALDQAILEAVGEGVSPPTIRFYGFKPACLSIGRFQPLSHVNRAACIRHGVDLVRRPTGGRALLHRDDFTYMVALPLRHLPTSVEESYARICLGIIEALRGLGVDAEMISRPRVPRRDDRACFSVPASADLAVKGRKLCGSAQTRTRGALLQHGTILRRRDTDLILDLLQPQGEPEEEARELYVDSCTGLEELGRDIPWEALREAMIIGFSSVFAVPLIPGALHEKERERTEHLLDVYLSEDWTAAVP